MKNFSNYKKHIEVDMVKYSGNFHFGEQLRQEGTDIKINEKSTQLIDNVDKTIRAIVRNHGNEYNETKEERSIMIGKEYDYKAGDYVEYLNDIYLTNNCIDKDNPFFNTAKMTRCNYILKWVDENGLHEQPCIVINNTKYTGGTKTLPSGVTEISAMVNITIQSNENTTKISYGKRLFTMKNAWQVTLIDNITTENTLSFTLGKDSINYETDDVIKGICDYYVHKYSISLKSPSEQVVENGTYQVTPIVTDNGKEVVSPNVTYTSSDLTIANVDSSGKVTAIKQGSCTITCSIGDKSAILNINVIALPVTPIIGYSSSWSNTTTLKLASSSTMTPVKTLNGIDDSANMNVIYTFDTSGSSLLSQGKISITKKTGTLNSWTIKNVSISTVTNIYVTFTDSITGTKILDNQLIVLRGV